MFIIKFAEPLFACLFGAILLKENIFQWQYFIAFILISVGIILGNKTKAYTFAITVFKSLSADVAEENKENLKAVQEFMDWIDEQENEKNYPHFENAIVRKIENLQNAPQMSGYDEKNNLAKYMFQCKVTYKEK